MVSQSDENGGEKPIAFASKKLNSTQQGWSTIEKENYAALWALQSTKIGYLVLKLLFTRITIRLHI